MTKSYKIRGDKKEITDNSSTKETASQAAKDVSETFTLNANFPRGKLYILEDELVFSQSLKESTIKNFINAGLSKGPIDLTTIGLYKPFEAPLEESNKGDSSWRVPYSDIEAISLQKIGTGYEIFLRPSGNRNYLYRIRTQGGNDYIGLRWLYSPNHDTAVQMAGEIFDQINRYRDVEVFNPTDHFVGQSKQVEFKKGVSEFADLDPVNQSQSDSGTSASPDTASLDDTDISESNQISENRPESTQESKTKEENAPSGTPHADSNDEQSSQGGVTDMNNEAQRTKSDTKKESEKISDTQSVDSSSSKRRWTYLILGIVLTALPLAVPVFAGGVLFGNSTLILILGSANILGLILILFGIYRIIRY